MNGFVYLLGDFETVYNVLVFVSKNQKTSEAEIFADKYYSSPQMSYEQQISAWNNGSCVVLILEIRSNWNLYS